MTERSRSASPDRHASDAPSRKSKSGGFKWKDKSKAADHTSRHETDRRDRDFRDRSPQRDHGRRRYEDDSVGRDERSRGARNEYRDRSPRRDRRDRNEQDLDRRQSQRTEERPRPPKKDASSATSSAKSNAKRPKPAPTGPMIVVNVNDRLGTKAAIPCLPSDSVKAFKAIVAAHIGRQPHEIMLKRQGERPFKDQLSLEDYGVSNGVQLDLEIDTGD